MNLDSLDGADVVQQHWPYDGPHSPDTVAAATEALPALVRYLANATGPGNSATTLPYAPQTYRLLGELTDTVDRLDQLLDQLGQATDRHTNDPTLYDDRRDRSARSTTGGVRHHLEQAREAAAHLRGQLSAARSHAAHLGHNIGGIR